MKSAVNLDTHTVIDIEFQPASLDIWDAKYRLTAKDGSDIDGDIDDTDKRVRVEAIHALGFIGGREAVAILEQYVGREPDPALRGLAAATLQEVLQVIRGE